MQIYMYNQSDVPLVAELGFTVGRGQHALVAIDYSRVTTVIVYSSENISYGKI